MLGNKLTLHDLTEKDLAGKRIVMRVDFNVPFGKDGKIANNQRIEATIPTIKEVFAKGANSITLLSHLGRPNGHVTKETLAPVAQRLEELIGMKVTFVKDCVGPEVHAVCDRPAKGALILLENVRFHYEEEGARVNEDGSKTKPTKEELDKFYAELTSLGDIYINDAFGTAHRGHASMAHVNLPIRAAGNLIKKELDAFVPVLEKPVRPLLSILGGGKVTDKIKLIENLLDKVDEMIITGGMAFTFLKVSQNVQIGKSIFDEEGAKIVNQLLEKAKAKNVKIHLPSDFKIADAFKADANTKIVTLEEGIPEGWMGLDIGPKTIKEFQETVLRAKTLVWNGPAGVYEFEAFQAGTRGILDAVAQATANGALTVIGGGDCAACAMKWGYTEKISHISTGGGASLELLEGRPMPGLLALSDKQ
ncbi:Phosphoglycerate kinase, putative [Trichomonas vaginalis G3]|uniref:Phosphoglycerate kinase n=1 Tax=Trichomonas vaginalis (strain ATCC PRA-98 / G3) TaxID=412133 RepID=A2DLF4_TRIV3|nr:phosphoglycerate kinase family [Trichomonas vaginalis G3]EAY18772.1 Phosphoglycerate kinase, putative [Trichomonas vaginalis G3]KAI5539292.1 phosphoglycerate kinase family [Trichomonas vaginalis G3]|eukprot:XP_001579758.1 Phosphoglycerate kinase [Trichomonas vaginalis G3]